MKQKSYSTRRLELRRLTLRDYSAWIASLENSLPAQDKFDKDPLPKARRTKAVFARNVARMRAQAASDEAYVWNIFLKSTGEMVGWVDLGTIARGEYQLANFGYFIINNFRRKGYAEEAARTIIKAAFQDLKFHRLEAIADIDNRPSHRMALKCGFLKEGIRKHYWFQNGRWEDQMAFVLTPELIR